MQRFDPPTVKPGQRVTAWLFEQMRRAIYACRLIAGENVRLVTTPSGTVISFINSFPVSCAWQVSLQGSTAATLRPGSINKIEATIKGTPLDGGEDGKPAPVLEFGKPKLSKEGRGYICAEITCDPDDDWNILTVEIVQVADPDTEDGSASDGLPNASGGSAPLSGNRSRHPLAMLLKRKDGRLDVEQFTCFDLQHRVRLAADQKSASRHFFW